MEIDTLLRVVGVIGTVLVGVFGWIYARRLSIDAAQVRLAKVQTDVITTLQAEVATLRRLLETQVSTMTECEGRLRIAEEKLARWEAMLGTAKDDAQASEDAAVKGAGQRIVKRLPKARAYHSSTSLRDDDVLTMGSTVKIVKEETQMGQTLVEYGLLLALIAVIVVVALLFLGPIVSEMFRNVGTTLNG